uniref:Uncharacterized protein n=1 Tax=Arundo donax TaxID=35708 RepID=A0A0A9BPT1_ARUDO
MVLNNLIYHMLCTNSQPYFGADESSLFCWNNKSFFCVLQ